MYTEKSPLTGGQPAYTYHDPTRLYKKQVKKFQCLLCLAVLALFVTALITAMMFSIDDNLDPVVDNNSSLEGKLSSPEDGAEVNLQIAPAHSSSVAMKGGAAVKPIKIYTSGTVTKGTATGGLAGEEPQQVFDGTLPLTIKLDNIIDPTAWSPTAQVTWSGVVTNNDTITGTYSLPINVHNGSQTYSSTYKGQFEVQLTSKWNSNLDIIIPKKVYNCKALFMASYGSSLKEDSPAIAKSTVKGSDDLTTESCVVLLQGSFYEKSFLCYLTPWWCTDDKLFYWNGGVEFKIIKPPNSPPPAQPTENLLKPSTQRPSPILNLAPNTGLEESSPLVFGSKVLGKVANGWVTVQEDSGTKTVWSGELPTNISLSMFPSLYSRMVSETSSFGHGLTWTGSVFRTSLRGTFKFPAETQLGMSKTIQGSFFFLLESDPSVALSQALESGVEYTSPLQFKASTQIFNGTQIIDLPLHNMSDISQNVEFVTPLTLLGNFNKGTFWWDGSFQMVVKKVPVRGSDSSVPASTSIDTTDSRVDVAPKPLLGSQPSWSSNLATVGSKLIGKVVSGWITLQDNSGTKNIWSGEFPTTITLPMFFNPTTDMSDLSDEFGHGITWSCTLFQSSLKGTFQLPQYTKFGLVKWMKGTFFFQLDSDPSWSLFDVIYPGINYNSPLHFRNAANAYNGSHLIKFYSHDTLTPSGDLEYKAPIILLGEPNKSAGIFSWSGRFEMIIKRKTSEKLNPNSQVISSEKQPTMSAGKPPVAPSLTVPDYNGSKLIGKVLSGWITQTDSSGTRTIWNGQLPATVSLPMFYNPTTDMSDLTDDYGHGAVWSCSVFHSTVKGSYQLPQYTKFGLVKWIKGSFFFELESSPNWSLYDNIVPGINYYSPVHFRNSEEEAANATKMINLYSDNQSSPMDDLGYKAPIVLLGKRSKGKGTTSFSWDGRFVMVVKKFF